MIVLPVFLTLYLIFVVVRFIDGAWGRAINNYLSRNMGFMIPGLGLILSVITVIFVGFMATNFFGKKLFYALEMWFLKFPFIRQIYPAAKQIVDSFISKESPAFKKVVMFEYPSKGLWSIGFLTNDSFNRAEDISGEELLHVFVATTPSPLTGFLVLAPKKDVRILDISIEEGIKLIVSGGIIKP